MVLPPGKESWFDISVVSCAKVVQLYTSRGIGRLFVGLEKSGNVSGALSALVNTYDPLRNT